MCNPTNWHPLLLFPHIGSTSTAHDPDIHCQWKHGSGVVSHLSQGRSGYLGHSSREFIVYINPPCRAKSREFMSTKGSCMRSIFSIKKGPHRRIGDEGQYGTVAQTFGLSNLTVYGSNFFFPRLNVKVHPSVMLKTSRSPWYSTSKCHVEIHIATVINAVP